jgi:hypothetical protein
MALASWVTYPIAGKRFEGAHRWRSGDRPWLVAGALRPARVGPASELPEALGDSDQDRAKRQMTTMAKLDI